MKHLKRFNESIDYNMDDYLGLPLFCLRTNWMSLECGVFTDENLGGYGIGIRGDYFDQSDFNRAMSKVGDSLHRKLYTSDELDLLIKDLGFDDLPKEEAVERVVEKVKKARGGHSSDKPEDDKYQDLYVELDEIRHMGKFI